MPLLSKMGYTRVRHRHGSKEYGKDITCEQELHMGVMRIAIVAKAGDIIGASSGTDTAFIRTIKDQIIQAFTNPIKDVTDKSNIETYVNQVVVWSNGKIGDNAQDRIKYEIKPEFKSNVVFVDGATTLELLEKYYPSYFTIGDVVISTYFESARTKHSRLEELHALGGTNAQKQLSSIFVSPSLQHIPRVKTKQAIQEGLPNKSYTYTRLLSQKSSAFLLGDMGSGKTAILRRLVIDIIDENVKELRKYPIPIFIKYKELALEDDSVLKAIEREYRDLSGTQGSLEILNDLSLGHFIVFLDGLDELKKEEDITLALSLTSEFMAKYPKVRVVVTSRMMEVLRDSEFMQKFTLYKVENFNIRQMKELIANWFGDDPAGRQLIKLISQPLAMSTLPRTPLTLALVAILYQSGFSELPANITELFEKYTELALGRWDMGKDLASQIDWKKKQLVMKKLSWYMLERHISEVNIDVVREYISKLSTERGLHVDVELFYREMVERSGLLIKNSEGNLEFKHRSFLDYFAGGELNSQVNAVEIVVERFPDFWWSRVIFFACGQKPEDEGEKYLKAILEKTDRGRCNVFHFALQIGLLAQATYLAHQDVKVAAIKASINAFLLSWDEIALELQDAFDAGKLKYQIHHLFLLAIFAANVQFSLGSRSLAGALTYLVKGCIEGASTFETGTELEKQSTEWTTFFLALASASAGNISDFVQLFDLNLISDPALLHFGRLEAEDMLREEGITSDDKDRLKGVLKVLRKKLKSSTTYLNQLASQRPQLLHGDYKTLPEGSREDNINT